MAPQDFIDTNYLPFPTRNIKQAMDEQFTHFVEMIEKIHVSVLLMNVLQVPSYAKYTKTSSTTSDHCHPQKLSS